MGFWDIAGGIAAGAVKVANKMKEANDEVLLLREEYRQFDDKELLRIWKSRSGSQKAAAAAVLRERGYGQKQFVSSEHKYKETLCLVAFVVQGIILPETALMLIVVPSVENQDTTRKLVQRLGVAAFVTEGGMMPEIAQ